MGSRHREVGDDAPPGPRAFWVNPEALETHKQHGTLVAKSFFGNGAGECGSKILYRACALRIWAE